MALTINSAAKDGRGIAWDYPAAEPYCLYCLETATYGNASRVDPAGALRPTLASPITHGTKAISKGCRCSSTPIRQKERVHELLERAGRLANLKVKFKSKQRCGEGRLFRSARGGLG